jgi:hypothetical protein
MPLIVDGVSSTRIPAIAVAMLVSCSPASDAARHAAVEGQRLDISYGYMLLPDFKNWGIVPTDTFPELRPRNVPPSLLAFGDSVGSGPPKSEIGPADRRCTRYFNTPARPSMFVIEYSARCPTTQPIVDLSWHLFVTMDSAGKPHVFFPGDLSAGVTVPHGRTADGRPVVFRPTP